MIDRLKKEIAKLANKKKAVILQIFFKTGKVEYGEGDVFLGITVPKLHKIAIKFRALDFASITQLLKSKIHHDLIQKAVGWMLRVPRTMLRYSIEKFPQKLKMSYLKKIDLFTLAF